MSMASIRSCANMSLKRVMRFCWRTRCVMSSGEKGDVGRGRGRDDVRDSDVGSALEERGRVRRFD